MLKYKILPVLLVSSALILGGCFNKKSDPEEEVINIQNEFLSVDSNTPVSNATKIPKNYKHFSDFILNKQLQLASFEGEPITFADLEDSLFDTSSFDYVGYIMDKMISDSLIQSFGNPSRNEINAFKKIYLSMQSIENPLSDTINDLRKGEDTSSITDDFLILKLKQIQAYKKFITNNQSVSEAELSEFYNSNAVNKNLYHNYSEMKNEIELKFYLSAYTALESEVNVHLLNNNTFEFGKDFKFIEDIVNLYTSNSQDINNHLKTLSISFKQFKRIPPETIVYKINNHDVSLSDIQGHSLKGRLGEAVLNEIFKRQLITHHHDSTIFEDTMKVIIRETGVHYYNDSYKDDIKYFIALSHISKKFNLTNDSEVEKYFKDNKNLFNETLHNELSTFEFAYPFIYVNFLNNLKEEELLKLKFVVLKDSQYQINIPEITIEIFELYKDLLDD